MMKRILGLNLALVVLMNAAPVLANWPYNDLFSYECTEAMKKRSETGFGCMLQGKTLQIGIFNFFTDDPKKEKAMEYERLLLVSRYLQSGGKSVVFFDLGATPKRMQQCLIQHGKPIHCFDWEPAK